MVLAAPIDCLCNYSMIFFILPAISVIFVVLLLSLNNQKFYKTYKELLKKLSIAFN